MSALPDLKNDFVIAIDAAAANRLHHSTQKIGRTLRAATPEPSRTRWSKLRKAIGAFVDDNRVYKVPSSFTPNTLSIERFPYIKVTADLTATSRDGLASDSPAARRHRELWIKLDRKSYDHLVDMAVHYPVFADENPDRLVVKHAKLNDNNLQQAGLSGVFNKAASVVPIDIFKRKTPYRGNDLSHIAPEIRIDLPQATYVRPTDGSNKALIEGEFVEATASFTGFPLWADKPFCGLRPEGLSDKTRGLAACYTGDPSRLTFQPTKPIYPTNKIPQLERGGF